MSAATTIRRAPIPIYHPGGIAHHQTNGSSTATNGAQPLGSQDLPHQEYHHHHQQQPRNHHHHCPRQQYYTTTPSSHYPAVSFHVERDGASELIVLDDTPPPQSGSGTPSSPAILIDHNNHNHNNKTNRLQVEELQSAVKNGTKRRREDSYPPTPTTSTNATLPKQAQGESFFSTSNQMRNVAAHAPSNGNGYSPQVHPSYHNHNQQQQDPVSSATYEHPTKRRAIQQEHSSSTRLQYLPLYLRQDPTSRSDDAYHSPTTTTSSTSSTTKRRPAPISTTIATKRRAAAPDMLPTPIAITPKVIKSSSRAKVPQRDKEGHIVVRVGDQLGSGRYRMLKQLGQGTFGKVIECLDMVAKEKVAIKVIRAVPKYRDASKVEIKVLNLLKAYDPDNDNKCIHLLDCFDEFNHICLVSELLSSSVYDFLKENQYSPFPASQIQSFARQLLKSVAFLHDLRLVHTDLKPENILLVDNAYGVIESKRSPTKRKRVLYSSDIRLIDFGSATFEEEYHANVVSTRHYRAPEIILGLGWSFPCDAWSIGCILVELFTGEALFQTHENLEHLAMMQAVLGPIPSNWGRLAARSKPEWFRVAEYPVLDYPNASSSRQSRKYVKAMRPLDQIVPTTNIVNARFKDLLRGLLAWQPSKRLTVKEALRHPYFALKIRDESTDLLAMRQRQGEQGESEVQPQTEKSSSRR